MGRCQLHLSTSSLGPGDCTTRGRSITYRIRHSPVFAIDMITCVGEPSTSEVEDTSILLTGLDPRVFYSVMVDAIIQDALPILPGPGKSVYMCILFSSMHLSCRSDRNYRSYCNKNTWVPLCWVFIGLHVCLCLCVVL